MQIVTCEEDLMLAVIRSAKNSRVLCLFNYSGENRACRIPLITGKLRILLHSSDSGAVGTYVTVAPRRPETFPKIAPFGVIVYSKEY